MRSGAPYLKRAPPFHCAKSRHGPRMATSSYFLVQGGNPDFYMKSSNASNWIGQTKYVSRVCRLPNFGFLQRYNFIASVPHGPINFVLDLSLSPPTQGRRVGTENREQP